MDRNISLLTGIGGLILFREAALGRQLSEKERQKENKKE